MAKVTFTTPIGVARFPKISKPDTTGDYADNKYKTDLVLDSADLKQVKQTITEFAKKEYGDLKNIKLPFGEAKDKETGETTEFVRFKSARKPVIIDAKRNKVPDDVEIYGGSKIRVGGTLNAYKKAGNKGVNIYLNAVQVIDLVTGFNVNDFAEVEDGFEVDTFDDGDDAKSEFDL
jgi:hypothetical protein